MKKVLRMTCYSLLIPAMLLVSFTKVRDRANFSGEWKLNEAKSELGDFGGFTARTLKVDQKENAITITSTTPGFNGGEPRTSSVTVSFDGKVTESEGFGGSKRKTSAKWSDDGSALTVSNVINFERDGQSNEFKSAQNWTVKDGMLTIVTQSNGPQGDITTKAVYAH